VREEALGVADLSRGSPHESRQLLGHHDRSPRLDEEGQDAELRRGEVERSPTPRGGA
jgi:hypothetical protein